MEELYNAQFQRVLEMPYVYKKVFLYEISKKLQEELKLSKTQILALLFIYTSCKITMSVLADTIGLENSSVTSVIANLTERGYIEKQINESDRRQAFLILTADGAKTAEYIFERYKHSFLSTINVLTEEECEAFLYHIKGLHVLSKQILKRKPDSPMSLS